MKSSLVPPELVCMSGVRRKLIQAEGSYSCTSDCVLMIPGLARSRLAEPTTAGF